MKYLLIALMLTITGCYKYPYQKTGIAVEYFRKLIKENDECIAKGYYPEIHVDSSVKDETRFTIECKEI